MFDSLKASFAARFGAQTRTHRKQLRTAYRQIMKAARRAAETNTAIERPDLSKIPGPFELRYVDGEKVYHLYAIYRASDAEAMHETLRRTFEAVGFSVYTARNSVEYDVCIADQLFGNIKYIPVDGSNARPLD